MDNDMKHVFLFLQTHSLFAHSGPDAAAESLALWRDSSAYVAAGGTATSGTLFWWTIVGVGLILLSSALSVALLRQRRRLRRISRCASERLRLIRTLLDICFTYSDSPSVFIAKFKDKVNIRELKSFGLIDCPDDPFSPLKEEDRLLCRLWDNGFSRRELCVVFNLKKINHLYIKQQRILRKLEALESSGVRGMRRRGGGTCGSVRGL